MYGSAFHAISSFRENARLRRGAGQYFDREVTGPPRPTPVGPVNTVSPQRRRALRDDLRRERRRQLHYTLISLVLGLLSFGYFFQDPILFVLRQWKWIG